MPVEDVVSGAVYRISNKASGTWLDTLDGSPDDNTKVSGYSSDAGGKNFWNQLWVLKAIRNMDNRRSMHFTVTNVRSGTVLDLHDGSSANRTRIQGFHSEKDNRNQEWIINEWNNTGYYVFENVQGCTVMDLDDGSKDNGTPVQGYEQQNNNPNQLWKLSRVSRNATEVERTISSQVPARKAIYATDHIEDRTYITLPSSPYNMWDDIWSRCGLKPNKWLWRAQIFDCEDFAIVAKSGVSQWAYDNIRADNISICFGIISCEIRDGHMHGMNWFLDNDANPQNFVFFEPQNRKTTSMVN
ncbi:hypothetical protein G7Y89_g4711 [Cudoniella acicularis]|uniref:Ricin B lectin domain-containing protein n=1 Tax=Cudoniella acicularis TaxID=354080 RepID=A0A8H4RNW6_9HELO|nr:hypothetical protein G7Y89_g4711 [Cudoniella acicularis]